MWLYDLKFVCVKLQHLAVWWYGLAIVHLRYKCLALRQCGLTIVHLRLHYLSIANTQSYGPLQEVLVEAVVPQRC